MTKKERRPLVAMDQIVRPKLQKISEYTGHDNSAEYWTHCLECHLGAVSKEEQVALDL
jgi:hypothetical protein